MQRPVQGRPGGRAQYTQLLNDEGGVLDDIIVWWVAESRFDVMPNASNTSRVLAAIGGADVTATRTVLAVQGPRARERAAALGAEAAAVGRFRVAAASVADRAATVAGTGYTGEDGIEIAVDNDDAEAVFAALLGAGVTPAGLGARDTLRLEAALPLHGHELSASITPLEAGLSWVVGWKKPAFRGREALEAQRASGPPRTLRGFVTETRQPPRDGAAVVRDGDVLGVVTSGNFSPVLERGIALALVGAAAAPDAGDAVELEVRGRRLVARCTALPFVEKRGLVADYLPHTDDEVAGMLAFLGLSGLDGSRLRSCRTRPAARGRPRPRRLGGARRARALEALGGPTRPVSATSSASPAPVPTTTRSRRRPGARRPLGVRDGLHALPARGRPRRPPGGLRVPDDRRAAGRPAGRQRLALRRGARSSRRSTSARPPRVARVCSSRRGAPALARGAATFAAGTGHRPRGGSARGRRHRLAR